MNEPRKVPLMLDDHSHGDLVLLLMADPLGSCPIAEGPYQLVYGVPRKLWKIGTTLFESYEHELEEKLGLEVARALQKFYKDRSMQPFEALEIVGFLHTDGAYWRAGATMRLKAPTGETVVKVPDWQFSLYEGDKLFREDGSLYLACGNQPGHSSSPKPGAVSMDWRGLIHSLLFELETAHIQISGHHVPKSQDGFVHIDKMAEYLREQLPPLPIPPPDTATVEKYMAHSDRQTAICAVLGRTRDKDAVDPLLEFLRTAQDRSSLSETVVALALLDDSRAAPAVAQVMNETQDSATKYSCCLALGYFRDPQFKAALVKQLKDHFWKIREAACISLARLGSVEEVRPLLQDSNEEVRYVAQKVLESSIAA